MSPDATPDPDLLALDVAAEHDGAAALPQIAEVVSRLRLAGDRQRLAWGLNALARALALNDRMDEAEAAALEALAHFRAQDSARGQALACNALAVVEICRGLPSRALDHAGEAAALARRTGEPRLQVRIASTLGVVLNDMGRLPDAVQVFEEGLRAAQAFPSEPVVLRLRANLSLALARWSLRDFDAQGPTAACRAMALRSIDVIQEVLGGWRAQGRLHDIATVLDNLAIAYLVLGRLVDAHAALDEAERLTHPGEIHYSVVFFAGVRARVFLQEGQPARALQVIAAGQATADLRGGHIYMDELWRLQSLAHERLGQLEAALAAYKRFHELRTEVVLARAEQQASALAVTLDTERALREVSEAREQAHAARREARHDALTGLANRRRFDEFLGGMLPRASAHQPVALVLIDIDHFKAVNDLHGHLAGDAALRWVASHLQAQCRQTDLPARLGGDEFALVLAAPVAVAQQVGERLRRAVAEPGPDLPGGLRLALSVGIAIAEHPCDPAALLRRADHALYAAKAAGRDTLQVAAPSPTPLHTPHTPHTPDTP